MGGLNLLSGTAVFMYNVLTLRRKIHMSRTSMLYHWLIAMTQVVLWIGAVALFMGFVEEVVEEEDEEAEEGSEDIDKKEKDRKNTVGNA